MSDAPDVESYGFESESVDSLRKIVSDIAADNVVIQGNKKEYNGGVNAILKENKKRMEAALDEIKAKQADAASKKLEAQAVAILNRS